jgi:hypothetical protein
VPPSNQSSGGCGGGGGDDDDDDDDNNNHYGTNNFKRSSVCFIIRAVTPSTTTDTLNLVDFTCVHCMSYGDVFWGNSTAQACSPSNKKSLH